MQRSTITDITARTIVAGAMVGHGLQKLVTWRDWPGPRRSGEILREEGLGGGTATAVVAGVVQVGAAALMVAAPRSWLGPTAAAGTMIVASGVKARNGYWSQHDGAEYPLMLAALGTALAVAAEVTPLAAWRAISGGTAS
ncbi:MAG: DoxX family membrane protein [Actinomycetota bacterium]